ncbi:hypothetical protein HOL46_04715 [Candidatus Falkowbacteria bacterium]|nr:hypothetical protein [Candidatus Falkowbacteria bacterium]
MQWQKRYLLILFFFIAVITAMFFIYSNIKSPERIEYYELEPSWIQKVSCIMRGGALEEITDVEDIKLPVVPQKKEITSQKSVGYMCHFH